MLVGDGNVRNHAQPGVARATRRWSRYSSGRSWGSSSGLAMTIAVPAEAVYEKQPMPSSSCAVFLPTREIPR